MKCLGLLLLLLFLPVLKCHAQLTDAASRELMQMSASTKRILFVDMDNTLGIENPKTNQWILYNGALDFLKEQSSLFHVVILSSNLRKNLAHLHDTFPELSKYVSLTLSSNDFAPQFANLMEDIQEPLKDLPPDNVDAWRGLLFKTFKANPARYLPPGLQLAHFPETVAEFRAQVYLPYILADKAPIVTEYNGILFDDYLISKDAQAQFLRLVEQKQVVFAGPRGGETPESGPDYQAVSQELKVIGCSALFD